MLDREINRQIDAYINRGYPELARVSVEDFRELFEPIRRQLHALNPSITKESRAHKSLVLVVTRDLIAPEARVQMLRLSNSRKPGIVDKNHWSDSVQGLTPYLPLTHLGVPSTPIYALISVERGDDYRNVAPEDAMQALAALARTPLTIDEGISFATVHEDVLEKNHCFMLGGSDRGDRRMPALWISESAPKLGWCFKGNPHTWLGVASVGQRVG